MHWLFGDENFKYVFKRKYMVINMFTNMFTNRFKELVTEDLFNSMEQLDRIEFQNRLIQQKQVLNSIKIGDSVLLVCMFISSMFLANYCYTYLYLTSLGVYSYSHISAIGNTSMVLCLTLISLLVFFVVRLYKINKFKNENDERLDFILDKE